MERVLGGFYEREELNELQALEVLLRGRFREIGEGVDEGAVGDEREDFFIFGFERQSSAIGELCSGIKIKEVLQ